VILGCAMPEGEQGLNVARIAALRAGLPVSASAVTVNRFCSSGSRRSRTRRARHVRLRSVAVAGGTESMSLCRWAATRSRPTRRSSRATRRYLSTAWWPRTTRASRRSRARSRTPSRSRATSGVGGHRRRPLKEEIVPVTVRFVPPVNGGSRSETARVRYRRGPAARHVPRGAGQAPAGVPHGGHGDCGQLLADERRRGGVV